MPHLRWDVHPNLYDSDHYPINITVLNQKPAESPRRWILRRANWQHYTSKATFTGECFSGIDEYAKHVSDTIISAASESIPRSGGKPRRHAVPWWTDEIAAAIKERKRSLKCFRRQPSTANLIAYKKCRSRARRLIKDSKRKSWERYVSSFSTHTPSSEVWEKLRRVTGAHKTSAVPGLSIDGSITTDPVANANSIGQYFANISSSENYDPTFLALKQKEESKPIEFPKDTGENYNIPFTEWELMDALSVCKDTSPGPDNIHNQMLKHLSRESLFHIFHLFNRIWLSGEFPSQ